MLREKALGYCRSTDCRGSEEADKPGHFEFLCRDRKEELVNGGSDRGVSEVTVAGEGNVKR